MGKCSAPGDHLVTDSFKDGTSPNSLMTIGKKVRLPLGFHMLALVSTGLTEALMWLSWADWHVRTQDNIHARRPRRRRLSDGACRLEIHDEPLFPCTGKPCLQHPWMSCSQRIRPFFLSFM